MLLENQHHYGIVYLTVNASLSCSENISRGQCMRSQSSEVVPYNHPAAIVPAVGGKDIIVSELGKLSTSVTSFDGWGTDHRSFVVEVACVGTHSRNDHNIGSLQVLVTKQS